MAVAIATIVVGGVLFLPHPAENGFGNYILVDHALSRAERGLLGILQVEGPPNPEIFDGKVEAGGGH